MVRRMLIERESADEGGGFKLPFGYYLERHADLLILRRADGTDVTVYDPVRVDFFDMELAVWEDAD